MKWNCPHCDIQLAAPDAKTAGTSLKGPSEGWVYVRCAQCSGFAMLESATGKAVKLEKKQKAPSLPPPPPAFLRRAPEAPTVQAPQIEARAIPDFLTHPDTELDLTAFEEEEELETPSIFQTRVIPVASKFFAIGGTAALLVGASHFLISLLQKTSKPLETQLSQKVDTEAMARASAAAARIQPSTATQPKAPPSPPILAQEPAQTKPPQLAQVDVSDSISSRSMAPMRPESIQKAPPRPSQLFLAARESVKKLEIRYAPDAKLKPMGFARVDLEYPVLEWKERWFKIALDEKSKKTAWVSYDQIELFSEPDDSEEAVEEAK